MWSGSDKQLQQGEGNLFFLQIFGGFFGPFLAKSDGMKI